MFFLRRSGERRRKIKVTMRVNSVNGGRKDVGGRSKKERQRKWGVKILPYIKIS